MTIEIKFKKETPEDLGRLFTAENDQHRNLGYYFFLEDGILKPMNSCEKFTYAYANELPMCSEVIGYVYEFEPVVSFQFENVLQKDVAKSLINDKGQTTFFAVDKQGLTFHIDEFAKFAKRLHERNTFVKFKQQ